MRLIDADKLIEDVLNSMPTGSARGVFRAFVDEQPTAFDVEKVARHIEDLKEDNFKRGIEENEPALLYTSSCLHKALEMVKAGGTDENKKDN